MAIHSIAPPALLGLSALRRELQGPVYKIEHRHRKQPLYGVLTVIAATSLAAALVLQLQTSRHTHRFREADIKTISREEDCQG